MLPCYAHTNTHMHACKHAHIHTKAKQTLWQSCETQLLPPSEPALGCLCTTQALEANPPGQDYKPAGGLSRSHGERLQNPKFHNDPNAAKQDKDNWAFAFPVNTRYPLMLQLGGLLSQLTPGN